MKRRSVNSVPKKPSAQDIIVEHTVKNNQHLSSSEIKELIEHDQQTITRWKRQLETKEGEVRYLRDSISNLSAAVSGLNRILDARR